MCASLVQGARHDSGALRTAVIHEGAQIHQRPGAPGHLQLEHHSASLCEGMGGSAAMGRGQGRS